MLNLSIKYPHSLSYCVAALYLPKFKTNAMKLFKIILLIIIVISFSEINAQETKKSAAFNSAVSSICNCLNKISYDSLTKEVINKKFTECFTMSAMDKILDIATERGLDFTNKEQMREVGIELGKELITQKCDGYLKFANASTNNEEKEGKVSSKESFTLGKTESQDFLKLVAKDKQGRIQTFYWLSYFEGSDKFVSKLSSYIDKKLSISWTEKEVFAPSLNSYIKIKELTGLQQL